MSIRGGLVLAKAWALIAFGGLLVNVLTAQFVFGSDGPPAGEPAHTKPLVDDEDGVTPLAPKTPGLELRASPEILTVGRRSTITVVDCRGMPAGMQAKCPVAPIALSNWSVNGVRGGNLFHGQLSTAGPANSVVYSAPNVINWNETVAVSASVPSATGAILIVANVRLVPEGHAYSGTIRSRRTGEGYTRRFTAEVGFDTQGKGSGRAVFIENDTSCTGEDRQGKVQDDAYLIFIGGFGPSGGDTYYQLGVNVFLQFAKTCRGPEGMVAGPPLPSVDTMNFVSCSGIPIVPGSDRNGPGMHAIKVQGDEGQLFGSAECAPPGSRESHRIQWDLRRVPDAK
jgi:hypothetical protein